MSLIQKIETSHLIVTNLKINSENILKQKLALNRFFSSHFIYLYLNMLVFFTVFYSERGLIDLINNPF